MTRVGWIFLGLTALFVAAFLSMIRFGRDAPADSGSVGPNRPKLIDHIEQTMRSAIFRAGGGGGGAMPALIVPVRGVGRAAIVDTWGEARSAGRTHHGTDIPASQGAPVLAAADGTIEKLFASQRGGTTLYERSADRGWTFYYAHLAGYAPGVQEGQAVRAGQIIAFVGDTGDAGPGNYHLHFGLARTTSDQRWYQGEDVNAFPALAGTATRR